jgi:hypothetical protein
LRDTTSHNEKAINFDIVEDTSFIDELIHFSEEQIKRIRNHQDCPIDDPELHKSKKHLAEKVSPLSLLNAIKAKHKEAGIVEDHSERKDPQNHN